MGSGREVKNCIILSNADTLGIGILVRLNTEWMFGTAKCVLFIEVSSFQGVLIRDVPMYIHYI